MKPRKKAERRKHRSIKTRLVRDTTTGLVVTHPAKRSSTTVRLAPPHGFDSWLDYAVMTMDTRTLLLDHCIAAHPLWPNDLTRDDLTNAARDELANLRISGRPRGKKVW